MATKVRLKNGEEKRARLETRLSESYDPETRRLSIRAVDEVLVDRFGYLPGVGWTFYQLRVIPAGLSLARVEAGTCQILDGHRWYGSVASDVAPAVVGKVDSGSVEAVEGEGRNALVLEGRLSARESLEGFRQDVADDILSAVSIGFQITAWTIEVRDGEEPLVTADEGELLEVSFVAVPANPNARALTLGDEDMDPETRALLERVAGAADTLSTIDARLAALEGASGETAPESPAAPETVTQSEAQAPAPEAPAAPTRDDVLSAATGMGVGEAAKVMLDAGADPATVKAGLAGLAALAQGEDADADGVETLGADDDATPLRSTATLYAARGKRA